MSKTGRWLSARIGQHLAEKRNDLGLTQSEVAKSLRVQRTSISNIESGKQVLLLDVFYDLCKELKVSASSILEKASRDADEFEKINSIVEEEVINEGTHNE